MWGLKPGEVGLVGLRAIQAIVGLFLVLIAPLQMEEADAGIYFLTTSLFSIWAAADLGNVSLTPIIIAHANKKTAVIADIQKRSALRATVGGLAAAIISGVLLSPYLDMLTLCAYVFGLVISVSTMMVFQTKASIAEGIGKPILAANARLTHSIAALALTALFLFIGTGPLSFIIASTAASVTGIILLGHRRTKPVANENPTAGQNQPPFLGVAVASLGAFLAFGSVNAVTVHVLGPVDGGRFALTFSILIAAAGLSGVLLTNKRQPWAEMAGRGDHQGLICDVAKTWRRLFPLTAVLLIIAVITCALLNAGHIISGLKGRLLNWEMTTALSVTLLVHFSSSILGQWSRSYLVERFIAASLIFGGMMIGGLIALGYFFGVQGVVLAIFAAYGSTFALATAICIRQLRALIS